MWATNTSVLCTSVVCCHTFGSGHTNNLLGILHCSLNNSMCSCSSRPSNKGQGGDPHPKQNFTLPKSQNLEANNLGKKWKYLWSEGVPMTLAPINECVDQCFMHCLEVKWFWTQGKTKWGELKLFCLEQQLAVSHWKCDGWQIYLCYYTYFKMSEELNWNVRGNKILPKWNVLTSVHSQCMGQALFLMV